MKAKVLIFVSMYFVFIANLFPQSISFLQSNSYQNRISSLVQSNIIQLQHSSSIKYAGAVTVGSSPFISYCSPVYYLFERSQGLAIFNERLEIESFYNPAFRDDFTSTQQKPLGWNSIYNSVSHDLVETTRGEVLISGALEIYFHNPQPASNCDNIFHSSKLFIYRTNVYGKISWAFGYDINVRNSKIIELENGNLAVIGNSNQNSSFFLLLNPTGRVISCRFFQDIYFDLISELKQTTNDILVVGNSTRYKVNPGFSGSDIICLIFDTRGNLGLAKIMGRNLNDFPGSLKYNSITRKYFIVMNSEINSGSINYDIIGFDCDGQLNISNQMGWTGPESEMAFDVLIDSIEKDRAYNFFGTSSSQAVFDPKTFLLQTDRSGLPKSSFSHPQFNQVPAFTFIGGSPFSNTFQFQVFPSIPSSLNLFKTVNSEYLLVSPSKRLLSTGVPIFPLANLATIEWKQTDLQLMRGACVTDPVDIRRFNPDIFSRTFVPSYSDAAIASYELRSRVPGSGSIDGNIDCGSKELIGQKIINSSQIPLNEKSIQIDQLAIFPNPAQERVTIAIKNSAINSPVHIRIIDMLGREQYSQSFGPSVNGELKLAIGFLQNGNYLIQASVGGRLYSGKLIKHNP